MTIPTVSITVADNQSNAVLLLPIQNVQFIMGVATSGTNYQPVATASPSTIVNTFTSGPLAELMSMVVAAGGIAIGMRVPVTTPGTAYTPVTSGSGTGLASVSIGLDGTFGAFDDYYVEFRCIQGGTLSSSGSSGITFQISLDAGRNWSPTIALAANALTYVIPSTGITITLGTAAETYVAGDTIKFGTVAPAWQDSAIQTALQAFAASQYALQGVGSMVLTGVCDNTDTSTIDGYMNTLFNQFIFNRLIQTARDAHAPTAWGGAGETEASWLASLGTAYSANNNKRACVGGGHYNMPSAIPNPVYGTVFSYRRPLAWADAVRRVKVPPQRRGGRVRDGSLSSIVVDPTTDPTDGFIYHDERVNPGLDAARFMSAMTWPKRQGFYICQERLMSVVGSQFTELVLGNVIDIACGIGYSTGVDEVSDDLRLNKNGTLYANDATSLQNEILGDINTDMTNEAMISSAAVSVSSTANVGETNSIPVTISVLPRGYVNSINETIGLAVPNAAPTAGG